MYDGGVVAKLKQKPTYEDCKVVAIVPKGPVIGKFVGVHPRPLTSALSISESATAFAIEKLHMPAQ
ncbi:MAG: hypothetical protein GY696_09530 [Gammaproteobacteria bacterium]|nr:hypothetical protein [Gammaproteobacteria bacterium]